jgi:cytochrome c oxidase subunit 2
MCEIPGVVLFGQASESFWLPPPDSTTAGPVDGLFYFILWVALLFFSLIVVLMVLFVILYRRRPGSAERKAESATPRDRQSSIINHQSPVPSPRDQQGAPTHNTPLEIAWTVIPLAIVIVIFYWGFVGYMDMRLPPREAYEIDVVARQWRWQFNYPNGYSDPILHVPVDQPVRLIMRSEDVIHSLWIPDFRVKMDVVPGRYTKTWFRAQQPGVHDLYCAEYCGTGHSDMTTQVIVHKPGEFDEWLKKAALGVAALSPAERGRRLYVTHGCAGCHSTDGTAKTGPSFKGIWGQTHRFSNAPPTKVDENYIRQSIEDPSAKVREGYEDKMNSFKGQLTDEEIGYLIKFIQSLK